MTVVVCRAFFKLNGQGRMPEEEMWAETWIGRAESQPCEGKFWSEGIAALKYKEARVAGSQWWGRWEKQGQVMWRFAGCDWRGMMGIQGSPSQGREWLGPEPRRAVAAYLPLQFCGGCSFFSIHWRSYCPRNPVVIFIPVQALHVAPWGPLW